MRSNRAAAAPPVVNAMSLYPTGTDPMRDWAAMYHSPHVTWDETEPDDSPFNAVNACAPLRAQADFVPNCLVQRWR